MSVIFPDVPIAAGVPAVRRLVQDRADEQSALTPMDDDASNNPDDWGIYDALGAAVLMPDSIVSIERGVEYRISTYPVEKGGFADYNKVATPFEVRLTLTKGGSVGDRAEFLTALDMLKDSLDLYDVVTPEYVYVGMNITRVSQARSIQSGAGMAVVEILLQEVRQTVSVAYTTATTDAPPPISSAATTASGQAPTAKPKPSAKLTPQTVKAPAAAKTANQGNVQSKSVVSGASLVTSASGRQLYVYDKPIGKVH